MLERGCCNRRSKNRPVPCASGCRSSCCNTAVSNTTGKTLSWLISSHAHSIQRHNKLCLLQKPSVIHAIMQKMTAAAKFPQSEATAVTNKTAVASPAVPAKIGTSPTATPTVIKSTWFSSSPKSGQEVRTYMRYTWVPWSWYCVCTEGMLSTNVYIEGLKGRICSFVI